MKKYVDIWDLCGQMMDTIDKRQLSQREVNAFLKLLAINLHLSRIYVYEYDLMHGFFQKAYGYNAEDARSVDPKTIRIDEIAPLFALYNSDHVLLADYRNPFFRQADYAFLRDRGQLVLQYGIKRNRHITSFIGMDIAEEQYPWLNLAIKAISACGRVMKLYYKQHQEDKKEMFYQIASDIVHQKHMIVYVTDDRHRILYLSDNVHKDISFEFQGLCYSRFMRENVPCAQCPLHELQNKLEGSVQKEIYSTRYHRWFLVTCSIIETAPQRQYLFTAVETAVCHLEKMNQVNQATVNRALMGDLMLTTGNVCNTLEYATKSYIFFIERKTGKLSCSEAFKKYIFSYDHVYTADTLLAAVYPADRNRLREILLGEIDHNRYYSYDVRIKTANGVYAKMLVRGRDLTMLQTGEDVFWGAFISASQVLEIDELTQLRNDRSFYDSIRKNITERHHFNILVMDINNFSVINYERSRDFGDRIIAKFANYLTRQAAQLHANCFRLLGDSFAVIFYPNTAAEIDAFYKNADGWLKSIYNIGVKGYICGYPDDTNNFEDLTRLLDYLQILTKQYRRPELIFYTPETKLQFSRYARLQKILRHSIRNDFKGFYLVYQPYINVQESRLIGAEALARYCDEDGKIISPAEFIPIIEKLQLMCNFGRWVIRQALKAAHTYNMHFPGFIVNINIAHGQLEDKELFNYIVETAQKEAVPLDCIELEFTEHFLSKEYEYINDKIAQIKAKGVKIAMDDFGTGYSSLGFLKNINVDIVKIDKIFLQDFLQDNVKKFFLECIISLCKKMDRCTILEGVEQSEEYEEIRRLGVDMVQGYYYSHPRDLEDVLDFIKKNIA